MTRKRCLGSLAAISATASTASWSKMAGGEKPVDTTTTDHGVLCTTPPKGATTVPNGGQYVIQRFTATVLVLSLTAAVFSQDKATETKLVALRIGHSSHGTAFDEGPRQRPWKIENIGKTSFPITANPKVQEEVQAWFDQGNTLLHSYWFYEAERAFRWCLKLDPDCAMAYWGLYRCLPGTNPTVIDTDNDRAAGFLKEASKRKDLVSEREKMYIEAWEKRVSAMNPGGYSKETIAKHASFKQGLEDIILKYPNDIEAKVLYANENLPSHAAGDSSASYRNANEALLQEILKTNPNHPGALHYRIHNWDGPQGWYALDSCAKYGKVAPGVGHALHMPGHVYASQGMWHEAAISLGLATRLELSYLRQRMVLAFNDWNYAHNLNYFCYVLEHLGRPNQALVLARPLLSVPLDPKYNNPDNPDSYFAPFREGLAAVIRVAVKFERWEELDTIPWRDNVEDKVWKSYTKALAYLSKGDVKQALKKHQTLKSLEEEAKKLSRLQHYKTQLQEVTALLDLAQGQTKTGLKLLAETAELEFENRDSDNDPPRYPRVLYNVLGNALLKENQPEPAVAAFKRALTKVPHDPIALVGLTKAHVALGDQAAATKCYAQLRHVWLDKEDDLQLFKEVQQLNLKADPKDTARVKQRRFSDQGLNDLSKEIWQPFKAPQLNARDSKNRKVTLKEEEYEGKNVLLIFFLGEECVHCMEQLVEINRRSDDFESRNTVILAISQNTPQENAASEKLSPLNFTLLSDTDHSSARRFKSYDDFEDMELHSTILINTKGEIHWARTGGDPFMDFDFLLKEIDRVNGEK